MLDIFDNIFGRSKTSKTSLQTTSSPQPSQEQENSDGFVLLGNSNEKTITDDPPPMYPVILTDEMIINGSVKQSHMTSTEAISSKTALNHKHQNSNPIDNVPFASLMNEVDMMSHSNIEVNNVIMTIDRIGMFLSTPSQSEYNFNLEKSILREGFFS